MLELQDCRLYRDVHVKADTASVAAKNTLGIRAGNRLQLLAGDWQLRAVAVLDTSESIAPDDVNTILVNNWDGEPGAAATCRRIGFAEIAWHTFLDSKRAWIGLVLAILGISAAYMNAGMQQNGSMVWHLGPAKSAVFIVSTAIALATWFRDTWAR